MKARVSIGILTLLTWFGCSAPESANRSPRCAIPSDCADGLICHRGFCVTDDADDAGAPGDDPGPGAEDAAISEPAPAEPATEAGAPAPAANRDASRPANPVSDANGPAVAVEAGSDKPPPTVRDASEPAQPGPEPDASTDPVADAMTPGPVDMPTDAGSSAPEGAVDASSRAEVDRDIGICLVLCNANQNICLNCLRGIVEEHPEVCDPGQGRGNDAQIGRLCALLCAGRGPMCGRR